MSDHSSEEDRVEPREWAGKSGNQSPVDGKIEITRVVNFAGISV